ncbi:MAG: putative bifunctional diguanylate cyclase/phosphodiesterase [Acidimicrobiales bacterium]
MTKRQVVSVNLFVSLIVLAGLCGAEYDVWASRGQGLLGPRPQILAIFGACCLFTELRPLRWLGLEGGGQVTASWTFMMALLLVGPPLTAVLIAASVVLVGEVVSHKPLVKVLFNLAQIVVSLSLAAAVLDLAGQDEALRLHPAPPLVWYPAFLLAGAIVFAVSNTLTCTVIALHQALPVGHILRDVGAVNVSTDGVLLSLSPVFVVVAERSALLVPLLLVTIWTIYRTAELARVRRNEATHDMLTQLPNRRLFDEHLRRAVMSARRTGQRVAVVLIDLNGFKSINDRLGHDVGDAVLRDAAARMTSACRSSDLLARLGGDEFAIVLPYIGTVAAAVAVAERVQATFLEPCVVQDFPVPVTASFGVAVLPDHAPDAATLLRRADETMYSAKYAHKGVTVFEPGSSSGGIGRIGLLADVAQALVADQFFLEYQPQVSLPTGHVIGVEALVRWRHPVAGVIYPNEFIALAEQTEFIGPITEWVIRHALAQCATWEQEGQHLRVAVNISARSMHDARFPEMVARVVKETGVFPGDIDLEIAQSTVDLDQATLHSVLRKLRASGVCLTIDDFGTGYSSMAQLRELAVDRLTIDRSFVTNMAAEGRDALIVGAIVQLGRALGIETIAKGVEDAVVARMLLERGCTIAQGFFFGKPVPPEVFEPHGWTSDGAPSVPPWSGPLELLPGQAPAPTPAGPTGGACAA